MTDRADALRRALGGVLIAVVLAVVAAGCSGERPSLGAERPAPKRTTTTTSTTTSTSTTTTAVTSTTTTTAAPAAPTTTAAPTTVAPHPPAPRSSDSAVTAADLQGFIATPRGAPEVHRSPDRGAESIRIGPTTPAGAPTAFAVIGGGEPVDGWFRVMLPTRPNGATGWVPADSVVVTHTGFRVEIDLAARRLRVTDGGAEKLAVPVAIGTDANPTPPGPTFVMELIKNVNPGGSYGPYAYGLAHYSDTATGFGIGQVGIHGTNRPALIGQAVSHGCIRLSNPDINRLVQVGLPLGAPVVIV